MMGYDEWSEGKHTAATPISAWNYQKKIINKRDIEIARLKKRITKLEKVSDTCKKCGTTEFLCGHNKKG